MAIPTNDWPRRLHRIRQDREWTQVVLAAALNVHPSTVAKWEQGLMVPHSVYRVKIKELEGVRAPRS